MKAGLKKVLSSKLADSLVGRIPAGTPRRVFGAVEFPGKVSAVIGMRRAGKTTFVHQLRRERMELGASPEALPHIDFEDERLLDLNGDQLSYLVEEHARRFPDLYSGEKVLWCFDEIQVVPDWERFARRLLDGGGCEVLVTGSSAKMLSSEIATSLRGRSWEVPIYPFGFGEALRHLGHEPPEHPGFSGFEQRSRLEHHFQRWLVEGGFPEAQDIDPASRKQLLTSYVDVAMLRDVVERHGVGNVLGLRWLVRHLLGNATSLFSVEKFHSALKSQGIAIGKDTVHQLLSHLEDCFLVRPIWMESGSERQRMVNPRKIYPVDPGLIPVFDRSGRRNIGHALETAVLIELQRRRCDVTYVRTPSGYEVDFFSRNPTGEHELIQVCADASDPDTAERELRALQEAGEMHPNARKLLLTLTADGLPAEHEEDVDAQPAYEWMLLGANDRT